MEHWSYYRIKETHGELPLIYCLATRLKKFLGNSLSNDIRPLFKEDAF